eukprot:2236866-Rhodomonas_salina.1
MVTPAFHEHRAKIRLDTNAAGRAEDLHHTTELYSHLFTHRCKTRLVHTLAEHRLRTQVVDHNVARRSGTLLLAV